MKKKFKKINNRVTLEISCVIFILKNEARLEVFFNIITTHSKMNN